MAQHDDKEAERRLREAKKVSALREAQINKGLSRLVETSEGREFLWWLLQIGKWATQPHSANALNTAFACGELNVGQQIVDRLLRENPAVLVQMLKDHHDARTDTQPDTNTDADAEPGA